MEMGALPMSILGGVFVKLKNGADASVLALSYTTASPGAGTAATPSAYFKFKTAPAINTVATAIPLNIMCT
jgi:hypothetical protein